MRLPKTKIYDALFFFPKRKKEIKEIQRQGPPDSRIVIDESPLVQSDRFRVRLGSWDDVGPGVYTKEKKEKKPRRWDRAATPLFSHSKAPWVLHRRVRWIEKKGAKPLSQTALLGCWAVNIKKSIVAFLLARQSFSFFLLLLGVDIFISRCQRYADRI